MEKKEKEIQYKGKGGECLNSKRKGNAGERELCAILAEAGAAHRNDQRYIGGEDNPDISFQLGSSRFHVECKRAEKFNAYAAMDQAERDANGHAVPIVAHRRNRRPWLVVLKLDDFLRLAGDNRKGSLNGE